ncbi:patatin-like phospholipase family protein [Patescibacteria group bacterium]|nr:patatin-like phospholipase family protein [Patescibacteria group bacterium]
MFHLFKKKIGLALGAGSAKGLAHIGVIKELEKNNISIDYIAGTSIGSVVGGMYALTKDIKVIEELAYSSGYKEMFNAFFDPSLKSSVFKGERVLDLLDGYIGKSTLIQDTKIPFAAVATDLNTAQPIILSEGNLLEAIRASISIPLLLKPVQYRDTVLIDGGNTNPVPVDVVRQMGAQKVIGVNLYAQKFPRKLDIEKLSFVDVINAMIDTSLYNMSMASMRQADVALNLNVNPNLPLTAIADDPSELIMIGEEATKAAMSKLKLL